MRHDILRTVCKSLLCVVTEQGYTRADSDPINIVLALQFGVHGVRRLHAGLSQDGNLMYSCGNNAFVVTFSTRVVVLFILLMSICT
jgi:hypothetical protein